MGPTYKQVWKDRILRQLDVKGQEEYKLRKDLHQMTGHGLARLSIAIEDIFKKQVCP